MVLFHRALGTPEESRAATPLVILHGLLGSSDNWQSLGLRWASERPVILVDQRNHGRSPHHPSHGYQDMVIDLLDTLDDLGIDRADLLGHSMGGKTVLHFADRYPERCRSLLIADMAPVAYPPHHMPLFDALASLDLGSLTRRSEAEEKLATRIADPGVLQFLLKGLYRPDSSRFAWRFNLPVLRRHLADMTGVLPLGTLHIPTLALYGTRSEYVVGRGLEALRRHCPQLQVAPIDAGHWLHAERPDEFEVYVSEFLSAQGFTQGS